MKTIKNRLWFFEEPDDKGGGEESKGGAVFDDAAGSESASKKEDEKVETPPPTANVDLEKFADILAEKFKPAEPVTPTVDKMDPAEAEKLLNVWKPTKEWIAKFGNLETQEAALSELRDGFIKHGDTISQFRMRELQKAIETKYEPVLKFMESYQEEQATKRFNSKYDQLSDPALRPVIDSITEKLGKAGKKFDSEEKLFDAIASEAEKAIQSINKDFKLTVGSSPTTTKPKSSSSGGIPVTTPGAGGSSATKVEKAPVRRGMAVFDPV